MISDGIRAFIARDWQRARDAKDAYRAERVRRLGPIEAMRIAEELRRQARLQHPEWPDAASRQGDLRHHVCMTELFARADAARRALKQSPTEPIDGATPLAPRSVSTRES